MTPASATTEPIDRSIPPDTITIVIATEMMPIVETMSSRD